MMRKYRDDYETVITIDDDGKEKRTTHYRGDYYEVDLNEQGLTDFKRRNGLLLVLVIALHISAGFLGNLGMYQAYIALPYVFAIYPMFNILTGVLQLPKEKRMYRRDEVDHSFNRMKTASIILIALLGIGLLGEIAFLLFGGSNARAGQELLFLALEVGTTFLAWLMLILQKKININTIDEQSL